MKAKELADILLLEPELKVYILEPRKMTPEELEFVEVKEDTFGTRYIELSYIPF